MATSTAIEDVAVLFVTANVGTLFEMADELMELWVNEFVQTVISRRPQFIALHCQELGGKKATLASMEHTNKFARRLLEQREMAEFDKTRFFLDESYKSVDSYTALGSLYFVHKSLHNVKIWDFVLSDYVHVVGKDITVFDNNSQIPGASQTKKSRFPIELNPLAKGNRKGFMLTRWNIEGKIVDLVNLHLFYDEDNLVAMETSPSQYTDARKWGLRYVIDSIQPSYNPAPFFIFGDFNFRLDVHQVVNKLTENGIRQDSFANDISPDDAGPPKTRVCFVENDNLHKLILTVEKKTFDHHDNHDYVFQLDNGKWLRNFDNELTDFGPDVSELEINFAPSYPYLEDGDKGRFFMKTRCPAWCDRIIMNSAGRELMDARLPAEYDLIGAAVCMGDHKPVFLFCHLRAGSSAPSNHVGSHVTKVLEVESGSTGNNNHTSAQYANAEKSAQRIRRKNGCFDCITS